MFAYDNDVQDRDSKCIASVNTLVTISRQLQCIAYVHIRILVERICKRMSVPHPSAVCEKKMHSQTAVCTGCVSWRASVDHSVQRSTLLTALHSSAPVYRQSVHTRRQRRHFDCLTPQPAHSAANDQPFSAKASLLHEPCRHTTACQASAVDLDALELDTPDIDNDLEAYQVGRSGVCCAVRGCYSAPRTLISVLRRAKWVQNLM